MPPFISSRSRPNATARGRNKPSSPSDCHRPAVAIASKDRYAPRGMQLAEGRDINRTRGQEEEKLVRGCIMYDGISACDPADDDDRVAGRESGARSEIGVVIAGQLWWIVIRCTVSDFVACSVACDLKLRRNQNWKRSRSRTNCVLSRSCRGED